MMHKLLSSHWAQVISLTDFYTKRPNTKRLPGLSAHVASDSSPVVADFANLGFVTAACSGECQNSNICLYINAFVIKFHHVLQTIYRKNRNPFNEI